jgi:hypothetical protein
MVDSDKNRNLEELLAENEQLRAEKALLQGELEKQRQKQGGKLFPRRSTLTWILILLTCFSAILAPIAIWARWSFLDTNNFADIAAPLAANEIVAKSLSEEVASRLFVQLEMQKHIKEALQEALPDKLDFMAGPIAGGLQTLTQRITYEAITSPQFQSAWDRILRYAHSTVVGIIRGDRALAVRSNGEVVLDTAELMEDVRSRLVGAGLQFLERIPLPQRAGEVVLFKSAELGYLKTGLELLDTLNWLLPFLFLVFLLAAIVIAEDRRKALMCLSIALAVAMAVSLLLLNLAEGKLLAEVRNPNNIAAAKVIWNGVTASLVHANVSMLILGVVAATALAVAGPYAWAKRVRIQARNSLALQFRR